MSEKLKKLMALQNHIVTFKVETPTSSTGQKIQSPVILVKEIWKTGDGFLCIRGIDFKKTDSSNIHCGMRSYRLDRIGGHVHDIGVLKNSRYVDPDIDHEGNTTF
jgi:hypothetical protein